MLRVIVDENNNAVIRAESWDLDHMYIHLLQFAGQPVIGIDYTKYPFPGYKKAASLLLAFAYEIRHANHGDRELYTARNGILSGMIAPEGTPREQIVKPEDIREPCEVIDYVEDEILTETDIDPDDFEKMSEADQRDFLAGIQIDPDDMKTYLAYLHRPAAYPFAQEDYPHASVYNTYIQFRLPLAETLLYALILNDLLKQKKQFLHSCERQTQEPDERKMRKEYEKNSLYLQMRSELLYMERFCEDVFASLYKIVDLDTYKEFHKKTEAPLSERSPFRNLTNNDIKRLEDIASSAKINSADDLRSFMEKI